MFQQIALIGVIFISAGYQRGQGWSRDQEFPTASSDLVKAYLREVSERNHMCSCTEGTEPCLNNGNPRVTLWRGLLFPNPSVLSTPCASCWCQPRGHQPPPEVFQWRCGLSAVLPLGPLGDTSSTWSNSMFHWQVETSLNKYRNIFKRDFYNSSPSSSTQTLPKCQLIEWGDLHISS